MKLKISPVFCFWCKNQVGNIHTKDGKPVIVGYERCPACIEKIGNDVFVFAASETPVLGDDQKSYGAPEELYPTGSWAVLALESLPELLNHMIETMPLTHRDDIISKAYECKRIAVSPEQFDTLFLL